MIAFPVTASEPGWQIVEAESIGWRIEGEAIVFDMEDASGSRLPAVQDACSSLECASEGAAVEVYAFAHEDRAESLRRRGGSGTFLDPDASDGFMGLLPLQTIRRKEEQ